MKALLGALTLLPLATAAAERSGEEVYNCTCIVCHGSGLLHAPKIGDAHRWKKLVAEGLDELVPMALKGVRLMPPKGGNPNLTDMDVARAVVFMANQGGRPLHRPGPDPGGDLANQS
ncbi:MAG: cytochrome c5 family protein [Rhodocyclaceae bacterium]|nr:cytochrome c5 family protein [Rhodocyclaceae bacterium]